MGGGVMSSMPQRAAHIAGHGSSMHQSSPMQASFASTGVLSGVRPHQVRPHALVA
jgi:hypothetical protein